MMPEESTQAWNLYPAAVHIDAAKRKQSNGAGSESAYGQLIALLYPMA